MYTYVVCWHGKRVYTGKTHIEYGAVFMPSLPRRRRKDGKPYGLTRHRLFTVLRLFWRTSKTVSVEISVPCRVCTYFSPLYTVVNAVFRQSTVVLAVFQCRLRAWTEYEGHRLWREFPPFALLNIARIVFLIASWKCYYWNKSRTTNAVYKRNENWYQTKP